MPPRGKARRPVGAPSAAAKPEARSSGGGPAADAPPPRPPPPPPPPPPPSINPTLLLDLLLGAGALDAVDLTVLARCSRELRRGVDRAWADFCARKPRVRLRTVARPVDDPAPNEVTHGGYTPELDGAGPCVECGVVTRFCHDIEGSMLCPACGNKIRSTQQPGYPLYRFGMLGACHVRKFFFVSPDADLRLLLPYAMRKPWVKWPAPATARGEDVRAISFDSPPAPTPEVYDTLYAPWFCTGGPSEARRRALSASARPDPTASPDQFPRTPVYLAHHVYALLLEKLGGPVLLKERVCNGEPITLEELK